jgi:hypothetical protein
MESDWRAMAAAWRAEAREQQAEWRVPDPRAALLPAGFSAATRADEDEEGL